MTEDAPRRSRVLLGVLAVCAFALFAGSPSIAKAETEVVTVPATVVAEWQMNPTNDLQCGALAFVKWTDPAYKVSEKIPVAWTAFYTRGGTERSISGVPPFNDLTTHVGATYAVGGDSHWLIVSSFSVYGAGAADGTRCQEARDNYVGLFAGPARVEITFDLKEPEVDKEKCKAAREELRKRNKAVGKLLGKLRKESNGDAKDRIREKLAKAKDKRADAAVKKVKACT